MRSGFDNSAYFKKFKPVFLRAISNNVFLALIISALIIYFLPPMFQKFQARVVRSAHKIVKDYIYYADLDNDGISEKILFGYIRDNFFNLTAFKAENTIEQWNFDGVYVPTEQPLVSPPDHNHQRSLYFFVYKENKIYLNCLDPLQKKFLAQNQHVADFYPRAKGSMCEVNLLSFYDSDNDCHREFYFSLTAGYSIQPRGFFKYDPETDSIYKSSLSFATLPMHTVVDTSGSQLRIITATHAYGNSKFTDPYTDHYAWLMCLNKDLNFITPPQKIGTYPSRASITKIKSADKNNYVILNLYGGIQKDSSQLYLLNSNLEIARNKRFNYKPEWVNCRLYSPPASEYFYAVRNDGVIQKMNARFEIIDSTYIPRLSDASYLTCDIDGDGREEVIFINEEMNQLIICRDDLENYTSVFIPDLDPSTKTLKLNGNGKRLLVICNDNRETELAYGFNNMFYLRYPVYAGICLAVFLFLFLIQKAQKHRAELKYETEKSIAELQLKAIKNQVDPHFTLNIINSIGSLFYKQDKEKADYIFGKYSKLLRTTILNSDKIVTTLGDELEYVENYLELERYRNAYNFRWKIDFDENANKQIEIPKMLIQTFVENSIKHGLRHREKDGELFISINRSKKDYRITIKDNGIGRRRAAEIEKGNTGKGLGILDKILELYYNLKETSISYQIIDLPENENAAGTEVVIKIPI